MGATRQWAPKAKLSAEQVERIRATPASPGELAELAEAYNVHLRTVQKIRALRAWDGVKCRLLPDETKKCKACHRVMHRRDAKGRRASNAQWAVQRACSISCSVKLRWREGVYKKRK